MMIKEIIFKGLYLKKPIPAEMLDFWIKMLQDFTKIALVAAFPMFYVAVKDDSLLNLFNGVGLMAVAYLAHLLAYTLCFNKTDILEKERN